MIIKIIYFLSHRKLKIKMLAKNLFGIYLRNLEAIGRLRGQANLSGLTRETCLLLMRTPKNEKKEVTISIRTE